jgi:hypothetical protein
MTGKTRKLVQMHDDMARSPRDGETSATNGSNQKTVRVLRSCGSQTLEARKHNGMDGLIYGSPRYERKTVPVPGTGLCPEHHSAREARMNELLATILGDPTLWLTATDRLILLLLAQSPAGSRVDDIARATGSKYRWIATEVSKLARIGILRRVAPNTYAINSEFGVKQ